MLWNARRIASHARSHRRFDQVRRLGIECLEERWVPAAPAVTSFNAVITNERFVHLSGYVTDESPSGLSVQLSGVVNGSAMTASDGSFHYYGTASSLGSISATVTDSEGLTSQPAGATITSQAPTIANLSATESNNGAYVTVSGTVVDESPGNRAVTFSGIGSGSTTTWSGGQFSAMVAASSLGTLTATVTDPWGLQGAAQTTLTSSAPSITSLNVTTMYGRFVSITGHISDASPDSATVSLSGVVSGACDVNADGSFQVWAQATGLGTISGIATDVWGQSSATASCTLESTAPVLSNVHVYQDVGAWWVISGTVSDDVAVSGDKVYFGGYLQGQFTTVASDGTFEYGFSFTGTLSMISAIAYDVWDQASNEVSVNFG